MINIFPLTASISFNFINSKGLIYLLFWKLVKTSDLAVNILTLCLLERLVTKLSLSAFFVIIFKLIVKKISSW